MSSAPANKPSSPKAPATSAFPLAVGADDVATGSQECSGYSYIIIPQAHRAQFERDAAGILGLAGMTSFHANQFRDSESAAYQSFLEQIDRYAKNSLQFRAIIALQSRKMRDELDGFSERLISKTVETAVTNWTTAPVDPKFIRTVASFAPALVNLLREARKLAPSATISVELDEDDLNRELHSLSLPIGGQNFSAAWLLTTALNGYRKRQFPDAPEFLTGAVRPVQDEKSPLVQAADVLGNFSMNFVFWKLGITSRGKVRKAEIFDHVFGRQVESQDFLKQITVSGNQNQDLKLARDGQAVFRHGWYEETSGHK
jgi:hypothetical protein